MNQYLYFLTIPGNEPFLKKEIEIKFPAWKFSYSRKGFCTFKNTGPDISLQELAELEIIYALTYGETIRKLKLDEVLAEENKIIEATNFFQLEIVKDTWNHPQPKISKKIQYDFIRTNTDEVFFGKRYFDRWKSPINRSFHEHRDDLISRAYYKAADAFSMLKISKPTKILELGCVPGGISQYLLENEHKVIGVDPAQMDESIIANKNFKFFNLSVQEYMQKKDTKIEIIVSDMNLKPDFVLKECLRISKFLPNLQYALLTMKTDKVSYLSDIHKYRSQMKLMGFKNVYFLQLPYHRKEFLALGCR